MYENKDIEEILEEIKSLTPKNLKGFITKDFAKTMYELRDNPQLAEEMRTNMISYSSVLGIGKFKSMDYINAVKYVTYKTMGFSNADAYKLVFPERYKHYLESPRGMDMVHKIVNIYNQGLLVREIVKRTLVPSYILYADIRKEAMMKQVDLMHNARSETVQQKAAEAILKMTQEPEEMHITMDMKAPEESKIEEYKTALRFMAEQQKKLIEDGHNTKDIINVKLVKHDKED